MKLDKWFNSPIPASGLALEYKLHQERSQSSCCVFEDETLYVFGGYHRELGTLNTIEKLDLNKKRIIKMEIVIP
jgi:hypothetical protein